MNFLVIHKVGLIKVALAQFEYTHVEAATSHLHGISPPS